jgi:hypothetical protein
MSARARRWRGHADSREHEDNRQEACFIYYKARLGLEWLELPPNTGSAERPVWDFMVMNSHTARARYSDYRLVYSSSRFREDLYRRVTPPGRAP